MPGSGKTTLLRAVVNANIAIGRPSALVEPGAPLPPRRTLAVIDDAQRLNAAQLAAVLRRPDGCVLAGPHSLMERLGDARRGMTVVDLPPVAPDEAPAFVSSLLNDGGEVVNVSPDALTALARHSGGLPGRMETIVRLAGFLARMEAVDTLHARHVDEAASVGNGVDLVGEEDLPDDDTGQDAPPPPQPVRRRSTGLRPAAVACSLAILLIPFDGLQTWRHLQLASSTPSVSPAPPLQAPPPQVVVTAPPPAPPPQVVHAAPPPPDPLPSPPPAPPSPPIPVVTPPALPALPTSVPMHVAVLVPAGDALAQARGADMVKNLRDHGYAAEGPVATNHRIAEAALDYFFVEDSAAATSLASLAGSIGAPRMASPAQASLPRPGSAEILLPPEVTAARRNRTTE